VNNLIKAIIVDDEKPAVDKMARMLKKSGVVDILGMFTDPAEALKYANSIHIDAAFIDIEMPKINGIELSNSLLNIHNNIAIVFVTAYNEYAVEAFRINAVDYLVKPLDKELLKETLHRIMERKKITVFPVQFRICCFGKFKVINEQKEEIKFRTAKAEELLAFFVDRRGVEVSRREIIDRIWSEFDGDRAVANFNTTLYYMKKALIQNGIKIVVERVKDRYRLNIDNINCDYYKFTSFTASSNFIDDSNIIEFEKIAALYTGDYLEENNFSWAERNKVSIKEKYIRLILKMADYYRASNQFENAIDILKTALKYEPLNDIIYYKLLSAFLFVKDRHSAVKYYNIYKKTLKKELGMDPNNKIKNLINRAK
jgi:two-component SAPR family response regulator